MDGAWAPRNQFRKNPLFLMPSGLRRTVFHDAINGLAHLFPGKYLFLQLPAPLRREPIILGAAIGFGCSPLGSNPTPPLKPVQRRIERTLFDIQEGAAHLVQMPGDGISVMRAGDEGPQDEQIEAPLKQRVFRAGSRHDSSPRMTRERISVSPRMSRGQSALTSAL